MPNPMQQLRIKLVEAQRAAADLQIAVNAVIRPSTTERLPVQALCARCGRPVYTDDCVWTSGAHYHNDCWSAVNAVFARKERG